jgi:hypothetical protein
MHIHRFLILAATLTIILLVAGCTTSSSPAAVPSATPIPAMVSGTGIPSSLVLTTADLPDGYVQTTARAKDISEVGEIAQDLGWQAGYVVTFTNGSAPAGQQDTIIQTITTYPKESMDGILGLMGKQETHMSGMVITDIPVSEIGPAGTGFLARVSAESSLNTPTTNVMPSVMIIQTQQPRAGPNEDFAEVYFTKGTTFEVIKMTGPHSDGAVVASLARTAYTKIP